MSTIDTRTSGPVGAVSAPSGPRPKPFTLVVGVDYSELGDRAVREAIERGSQHERAHLHLIHVTGAAAASPHVGMVVQPDLGVESSRLARHADQLLTDYADSRPLDFRPPFERVTTHVGIYDAALSISQLAADVEADLVVVGTHGRRGMMRFLLGSVAESTVRLSPCAVLVVREPGATSAAEPQIEPACPRCLQARSATDGKEFWCAQHQERHGRRHTYAVGGQRSSHQSGFLVPL